MQTRAHKRVYIFPSESSQEGFFEDLIKREIEAGLEVFSEKQEIENLNFSYVQLNPIGNVLMFPISFDLECSQFEILFGFYLPFTNTYVGFIFQQNDENKFLSHLLDNLIAFLDLFRYAHLVNRSSKVFCFTDVPCSVYLNNGIYTENLELANDFICQCVLITYNGKSFDIPLLSFMLDGFLHSFNIPENILAFISENSWNSKSLTSKQRFIIFPMLVKYIIELKFSKDNQYNQKWHIFPFSYSQTGKNIPHLDLFTLLKEDAISGKKSLNYRKHLLFLRGCKNNSGIESPCEFEDLFGKAIDHVDLIGSENWNLWVQYNFNDCFYTILLYFETQAALDKIESRLLFYKQYSIPSMLFSESLAKTDTQLAVTVLSLHVTIEKKEGNTVVGFEDLTFIYDFPIMLENYKEKFSGLNYCKCTEVFPLEIKGCKLNLSRGGLHSALLDTSSKQVLTIRPSDSLIYMDFDVQSFYVMLFIKICRKLGMYDVANYVEDLGKLRLSYKKAGNPLQKVLKIIILSITGSLNSTYSKIYNPQLYFSITSNGQLFLAEFLIELENLYESILFVNTDGTCLCIQRSKFEEFICSLNKIEQSYDLLFDTREEIEKGFILDVNTSILFYKKGNIKIGGFDKNTAQLLPEFLKFLLTNNIFDIDENNVVGYIKNFLNSVFSLETVDLFFFYRKRKNDRFMYFFSKYPQTHSGINVGGAVFHKGYPISILQFEPGQKASQSFLENIKNDLCFSSYICSLIDNLHTAGFLKTKDPLCFSFDALFENDNLLWNNFSTNLTMAAISFVSQNKYFIFPKSVDKKSFKGMKTSDFMKDLESPIGSFEKSLREFPGIWFRASTITVDVKKSFPFVCFDFDDIHFLYKNRNEKFLEFLQKIKQNGHLILSSPVYGCIYRFKILLEVSGFESQKEFETFLFNLNKNIPVSYENFASVYGAHMGTISLKSENLSNKVLVFSKEDLEEAFSLENSNTNMVDLISDNSLLEKHVAILSDLFSSNSFYQDQVQNVKFLSSSTTAKNFKFIHFENETEFLLFEKVLEKILENSLQQKRTLSDFFSDIGRLDALLLEHQEKMKTKTKTSQNLLGSQTRKKKLFSENSIAVDASNILYQKLFDTLENSEISNSSNLEATGVTIFRQTHDTTIDITPDEIGYIDITPDEIGQTDLRQTHHTTIDITPDEIDYIDITPDEIDYIDITPDEFGVTLFRQTHHTTIDITPDEIGQTDLRQTNNTTIDITPDEIVQTDNSIVSNDEILDSTENMENAENITHLKDTITSLYNSDDKNAIFQFFENHIQQNKNQHFELSELDERDRSLETSRTLLKNGFSEVIDEANKKFGLDLVYYPEFQLPRNKHTLIFHSPCAFDKKEDNPRQVTFYVTKLGCHINCFHQKCKSEKKYSLIQNQINSKLIGFHLTKMDHIFMVTNENVSNLFSEIFENPEIS
jgi:hypothetical protein